MSTFSGSTTATNEIREKLARFETFVAVVDPENVGRRDYNRVSRPIEREFVVD
jgi:hypothetical protein